MVGPCHRSIAVDIFPSRGAAWRHGWRAPGRVFFISLCCGVEQRLARQAHNLEVAGSIPAPTIFKRGGLPRDQHGGTYTERRATFQTTRLIPFVAAVRFLYRGRPVQPPASAAAAVRVVGNTKETEQ